MLFESNRPRPAIIRAGAAVSDWQVPETGMAHGDPMSPLAAALVAGAHARCLRACVPGTEFYTYVDPAKEEFAGINLQENRETICPQVNKDFLDLFGHPYAISLTVLSALLQKV